MKSLTFITLFFSILSAQELFFSEYIEGSSNNKALEIFNPSDSEVDLSEYSIWRISNGGDWAEGESNDVPLDGYTLAPGDVFVVCNSSIADEYSAPCDIIGTSATWFNGDDAVGLAHNGSLVDAIGEEGADPGSGWAVAGVSNGTKEHTLVRKPTVTQGNLNWSSSAGTNPEDSEWIVYDQNEFTFLGDHVCTECGGGGDVNYPPVAVAGDNQMVSAGEIVTLDGSGSYDSDGTVIAYEWAQTSGEPVSLSDYESAVVTFTAPDTGGDLVFQLTVWDDEFEPDTDNVTVSVCGGLVSISEARSGGIGQCLSIQGVVTSPNFQSSNSEYTIQDESAGLVIFGYGTDLALNYGDEIFVTGITDEYNGKFELIVDNPENITVIGPGSIPDPQVLTVGEFIADAENFESELVTLSGVSVISGNWPEEGSSENLTISDGSGETTMRIDSDTDIDGSLEPSWPVDVTGVGGQFDYSDPYDSGYQILPRFVSDFEASTGNLLPIANAGENQFVSGGDEVTLNGLNSYDPDGEIVGYVWTQTEGTSVTLSDYEEPVVTFTAPMDEGLLVFNLEVFDDTGASNSDNVSIFIADEPMSITEIQSASDPGEGLDCYPSPFIGQTVFVTGIVTAIQPGSNPRFYMQDPWADSFSGVYVFDYSVAPAVGDELWLSAEVEEYFGFTELQNVVASTTISTGNNIGSTLISTGDLSGGCSLSGEEYEGVLVKLQNVTVIEEPNEFGEWIVDDGSGPCQIDDQMFDGDAEVYPVGTTIASIVGVVDYAYSAFGVNPRNADDISQEEGECVADGDTNGDDSVDVLDIVQIVGYILGNTTFTDNQFCIADVNVDVSVDVLDVVMIVNWILNPRSVDASSISIIRDGFDVSYTSDGYVGAIQMTLSHDDDFSIELTDIALVSDFITIDKITKLIIVYPEENHLFTTENEFEIEDVIAANSNEYISVHVPKDYALLNSYPNPFNPNVTLSYFLPSDTYLTLAIFSMTGEKITSLSSGYFQQGNYQSVWNGMDTYGNDVSSGIYIARLQTGNEAISQKVTLLK